ncbi:MAG: N,N-dimethylformamidase beta subunit family domain-containing protein [Sphingomonadaceae bacterium]
MRIQAYFEEWSRRPGDSVRLAISAPDVLVKVGFGRLVTGPETMSGNSVGYCPIEGVVDGEIACRKQANGVGSYAKLPITEGLLSAGAAIHCWIWPTVPDLTRLQTIWTLGGGGVGLRLVLRDARLELISGGDLLAVCSLPITAKRWYSVHVDIADTGTSIEVASVGTLAKTTRAAASGAPVSVAPASCLLLAAHYIDDDGSPVDSYNGKIDSPLIFAGPMGDASIDMHRDSADSARLVGRWDFAADFGRPQLPALTASCADGMVWNGAERGVTGHRWDGTSESFVAAPEHYTAIQFHDDDVIDCAWDYDLSFELPSDLPSGVYAVRLEAEGDCEYYPLFVAAKPIETAPILFLVPTNTYVAYANNHLAAFDFSAVMSHQKVVPEDEQILFTQAHLGRSLYDVHSDGTPVRYVSRRRPLLNVRPNAFNWLTNSHRHFAVDLFVIEWLERLDIPYHVATDEQLEREGCGLLSRYDVVVTGSHPEYWTKAGLSSLEQYLRHGGRLMYLGGNGFYWVSTKDPHQPWVMEVRRDHSGTRCWDAPYGERTHTTTGELGGIWRLHGASPNQLVGVGFAAEGWSRAGGYRRLPASYEGAGAAFFDGIADELVGENGFVLGGAVGDEVDRFDIALGSPPHAEILATSVGLGREYQLAIEDQTLTLPDQDGVARPDMVRADMVYFEIDGGGAVFSAGSIAYAGALAWNGFDNSLCRMTTNVIRQFAGVALSPAGGAEVQEGVA